MESEGGERPTRLSVMVLVSMMLMDMCCSTTLFTTLTDSQASDSCLAELSLGKREIAREMATFNCDELTFLSWPG